MNLNITKENVDKFVELVSEISIKHYNQEEYIEIVDMIACAVFAGEPYYSVTKWSAKDGRTLN